MTGNVENESHQAKLPGKPDSYIELTGNSLSEKNKSFILYLSCMLHHISFVNI